MKPSLNSLHKELKSNIDLYIYKRDLPWVTRNVGLGKSMFDFNS